MQGLPKEASIRDFCPLEKRPFENVLFSHVVIGGGGPGGEAKGVKILNCPSVYLSIGLYSSLCSAAVGIVHFGGGGGKRGWGQTKLSLFCITCVIC